VSTLLSRTEGDSILARLNVLKGNVISEYDCRWSDNVVGYAVRAACSGAASDNSFRFKFSSCLSAPVTALPRCPLPLHQQRQRHLHSRFRRRRQQPGVLIPATALQSSCFPCLTLPQCKASSGHSVRFSRFTFRTACTGVLSFSTSLHKMRA
jgi:hypothetical protein